jgi:hypothetical protein
MARALVLRGEREYGMNSESAAPLLLLLRAESELGSTAGETLTHMDASEAGFECVRRHFTNTATRFLSLVSRRRMRECECDAGDKWRLYADDFLRKDVGIGRESDKEGLESSAAETRARNSVREKGGRHAGGRGKKERRNERCLYEFIWLSTCNPKIGVMRRRKKEGRRRVYLRVLDVLCQCVASPSAFCIVVWLR